MMGGKGEGEGEGEKVVGGRSKEESSRFKEEGKGHKRDASWTTIYRSVRGYRGDLMSD